MKNAIIIGLGHRARQGKDYLAEHLAKRGIPNGTVHIIHWADELYAECKNGLRAFPLIRKLRADGIDYFFCLTDPISGKYKAIYAHFHPELTKMFEKKETLTIWGMDEKDGDLLQFWGTDFRRKYFGNDYWVNRGLFKVKELSEKTEGLIVVLIPDTRFLNEVKAIRAFNGNYINVMRLNPDGSRFFAEDRDRYHKSETELDGYDAEYTVICKSGEVELLKKIGETIFDEIISEKTG